MLPETDSRTRHQLVAYTALPLFFIKSLIPRFELVMKNSSKNQGINVIRYYQIFDCMYKERPDFKQLWNYSKVIVS